MLLTREWVSLKIPHLRWTDPIAITWTLLFEAAYHFEAVTVDTDLVLELLARKGKWKPPQG